jgi:hypothetical protein
MSDKNKNTNKNKASAGDAKHFSASSTSVAWACHVMSEPCRASPRCGNQVTSPKEPTWLALQVGVSAGWEETKRNCPPGCEKLLPENLPFKPFACVKRPSDQPQVGFS